MTELKRCPFCGAKPPKVELVRPFGYATTYFVVCDGCGVKTSAKFSKEEAVKAWNKRYKETEQNEEKTRQIHVSTVLL